MSSVNKYSPERYSEVAALARMLAECGSGKHVGASIHELATALLDLVEVRGLPSKMICHPSIQLVTGDYFNFLDPDNSPMPVEAIAHSLAKLSRYNGHTLGPHIYSIGQHVVLASRAAPREHKFAALMHDAPEFVMGDMTTPLKQLCPDFKLIEKRTERAFASRFGLIYPNDPAVKIVDHRMAATEKRDLMPSDVDGDEWQVTTGFDPYPEVIEPWTYQESRDRFIEAFHQLNPLKDAA